MNAGDVVIDDHLLLRVLLDDEPADLRRGAGRIWTTGLWYHRLARALAAPTVTGALSRQLGGIDQRLAANVVRSMIELPVSIGLVSLRDIAGPMAQMVGTGLRLNLMSLEALAAAEHTGATICLASADASPPMPTPHLTAAAAARGVRLRLLD